MKDFFCRSFCIAKVTFDMCRFPSGVWSGCGVGIRRRVWPVPSPGEWQPCPSPSVCLRKWTWVSDRKLDTASDSRTARPPKLSSSKYKECHSIRFEDCTSAKTLLSKKISACWVMCKILKTRRLENGLIKF